MDAEMVRLTTEFASLKSVVDAESCARAYLEDECETARAEAGFYESQLDKAREELATSKEVVRDLAARLDQATCAAEQSRQTVNVLKTQLAERAEEQTLAAVVEVETLQGRIVVGVAPQGDIEWTNTWSPCELKDLTVVSYGYQVLEAALQEQELATSTAQDALESVRQEMEIGQRKLQQEAEAIRTLSTELASTRTRCVP